MEKTRLIRPWRRWGEESQPVLPVEPEPGEVTPPTEHDSEDTHGGDEAGQVIPDSPNPAEGGEQESGEERQATEESQTGAEEAGAGAQPVPGDDAGEGEADGATAEGVVPPEGETEETGAGGHPARASDNEGETEDWEDDPDSSAVMPGRRNSTEAFDVRLEQTRLRRLQAAVATLFANVAEDLAGWPVPGDEEWDVGALMMRRFDRRPLTACRQSRERERVIMVVDTSYSCDDQAHFYRSLAMIAVAAGDVELYTAPNAELTGRVLPNGGWQDVEAGAWPFRGRTIVFFGDFDGSDQVIESSWVNTVWWFSCENRYQDTVEHSWCSYPLRAFRGRYIPCRGTGDFLRAVRRLRA